MSDLLLFHSTPSVGRATIVAVNDISKNIFQSTPSVGRATRIKLFEFFHILHFNPRPPWGGRHYNPIQNDLYITISIHALRGEGDVNSGYQSAAANTFQSTPSVGRATVNSGYQSAAANTFQSTPSVGRATHRALNAAESRTGNFNPRPPWGGRLQKYTNIQYCVCT